jgi:hypothetical protein
MGLQRSCSLRPKRSEEICGFAVRTDVFRHSVPEFPVTLRQTAKWRHPQYATRGSAHCVKSGESAAQL